MPVSMDEVMGLSPQFQTAFKKAVDAQARPLENLEEKKGNIENRVNLLTDIIDRVNNVDATLNDLGNARSLRELLLSSTQENAVTGTVDKEIAEPGAYDVEVLQMASNASALSNGFPDKNETRVGSGYFAFSDSSGDTQEIYIDNDNATLDGIAKTINSARLGMKASVVRDASDPENPFRLALSADGTGAENTVEYPTFYFIDGESDFFVERENAATNAVIRYEGLEIETDTNRIENLIPGVTLNIQGVTAGSAQIKIGNDVPKIKDKVLDWVDKVNSVLSFIQEQNNIDETTPTERTLGNDYGIRMVERRFRQALRRNQLFDERPTSIRTLADLGIEFNKNGTLDVDDKKLETSINANFGDVADLLSGDGRTTGVITGLKSAVATSTTPRRGVLTLQKKNYSDRVRRIQDNISRVQERVEKKAEKLKEQLITAQNSMQDIQRQTAGLSAMGSGGGLMDQLLG